VPRRWRQLVLRASIACAIAWIIATMPIPRIGAATWIPFVLVPTVIFLLICYIGKLLIDTLFYNHYEP
jgi:hypothetical protein